MSTERIPLEARLKEMHGIAFLEAVRDGRAPPPPIALLMKFEIVEIGEGRVVFSGHARRQRLQPARHGAWRLRLHAARLLHGLRGAFGR